MDSNDVSQPGSTPDISRRKLLKGAAATGIVLSVSSRSAWGTNCSISGMLSGNLSRTNEYECHSGRGKCADFWKDHPGCWPSNVNLGKIKAKLKRKNSYHTTEVEICSNGHPKIDNRFIDNYGKLKLNAEIYHDNKRWIFQSADYHYGDTLNDCLPGVSVFGQNLMYYIDKGDSFTKRVSAAMLSALHADTQYGYTPWEISEAVLQVLGDPIKETELANVLAALEDGTGASYDSGLVVYQRCS